MRRCEPFQADDLAELDGLLRRAALVVPMRELLPYGRASTSPHLIALRHDVDNELAPALALARWEAERGYRATYFLLHSAPYWDAGLPAAVEGLLALGHEVGIHNNAIAERVRTGRDPHEILAEATERLRDLGANVVGTVAHGDKLCHERGFVNDEMFEECVRTSGLHGGVPVERKPLAAHGLVYDANWIPRDFYASDSGGVWRGDFDRVPGHDFSGQLHLLIHPCWWRQAFGL